MARVQLPPEAPLFDSSPVHLHLEMELLFFHWYDASLVFHLHVQFLAMLERISDIAFQAAHLAFGLRGPRW